MGRQVLWNGTEHSFEVTDIKLCSDLALSKTPNMMTAGDNDYRYQKRENVVVSSQYLVSEPEKLCSLHVSLSQVGQNISQIIIVVQKLYPGDTTMDARQ